MAAIGQVIDDKYEILKLVGQGGMSKVYLAMDKRLNKQWAVKEIEKRAKDRNNEIVIQSAIAEANLIKQLDHPAIVRIVDIIDNGNVIYIIEDYIEGKITREAFWVLVKFKYPTHQIVFATDKALDTIKFERSYEV